jgi:hypothetical protein
MRRLKLVSAAAAVALMAASGAAFAQEEGGPDRSAVDNVDIDYYNDLSADISVDSHTFDLTILFGGALLTGNVQVDSKAASVADSKQVLHQNDVNFREENWIAGANGYVDPVFGPGREQDATTNDGTPADPYLRGPFTPTGRIESGYFVPVINTVAALNITGVTGNVGANFAAGYQNQQENVAALATSNFDPGATEANTVDTHGGWASASTMALQSLEDNFYGPNTEFVLGEDNDHNDYRDRNTVAGGAVNGSGNIGVNAAAGAFNQQQNMLSVAVASEAALSQANSGVFQNSFWNDTTVVDTNNFVGTIAITGAGNIGVNAAAGVGNQQHNSLTIAASAAGGTAANGGGTGGGPLS